MDNLPLTFLLGFPFFVEKGAIFDLTKPTVVLTKTENKSEINLISTSSESFSAFYSFSSNIRPSSDINTLFCTFEKDISGLGANTQLQDLLQEFASVFDLSDTTPANVPEIDLKLKQEFQNKVF